MCVAHLLSLVLIKPGAALDTDSKHTHTRTYCLCRLLLLTSTSSAYLLVTFSFSLRYTVQTIQTIDYEIMAYN